MKSLEKRDQFNFKLKAHFQQTIFNWDRKCLVAALKCLLFIIFFETITSVKFSDGRVILLSFQYLSLHCEIVTAYSFFKLEIAGTSSSPSFQCSC